MESDIEEGEIIENINELPAASPISSNSGLFPDRTMAPHQRRLQNRESTKSSKKLERVHNGASKRKRSTETRVENRRLSEVSCARRLRKSSRSPSRGLPKQYQNRLRENIHRRRLRHSRKSSPDSRSNSPYAHHRVQNSSNSQTGSNAKENITVTRRNGKRRLILRSNSNAASDTSVVSVTPPPKTLPELIVLDSSPNSDSDGEDVRELQLRKEALEALLCNFEDTMKQENEIGNSEVYSPTSAIFDDDDFLEHNLCPDENVKKMDISSGMGRRTQEQDSSKSDLQNEFAMDQKSSLPKMDISTIPLPPAMPVASFLDSSGISSSTSPMSLQSTGDVDMRFVHLSNNAVNTAALLQATLAQNYQAIAQMAYSGDRDQLLLQNAALIQSLILSTPKLPCGPTASINPVVFPNPFFDVDSRQNHQWRETPGTSSFVVPESLPKPTALSSEVDCSPHTSLEHSLSKEVEDNRTSEEVPAREVFPTEVNQNVSSGEHMEVATDEKLSVSINSGEHTDGPKAMKVDQVTRENSESIDWSSLFTRRKRSPQRTLDTSANSDNQISKVNSEVTRAQVETPEVSGASEHYRSVDDTQIEKLQTDVSQVIEHVKTLDNFSDTVVTSDVVVPTIADTEDSITEDEEVLRAQLLLDLSRKKITKPPTAVVENPVSPTVVMKVMNPQFLRPSAPVLPSTTTTSSHASYNHKVKGMFRVVNVHNEKARVISKLHEKSQPQQQNNLTFSEPVRPPGPHLQIRRTIINTNAVKKNIYTKNVDPVLKNLTIVVPNKAAPVRPLIIPVRHDDSSSEDEEPARNEKQTQVNGSNKVSLSKHFQSSLDDLLKNSRQQAKPVVQKSAANEALQHLPASKLEEYMQLIKQIERHEQLIQRKQESKRHKALARSLLKTVAISEDKCAAEPMTASTKPTLRPADEVQSKHSENARFPLQPACKELEKPYQAAQDSSAGQLASVENSLHSWQDQLSLNNATTSAMLPTPEGSMKLTEASAKQLPNIANPTVQVDTSDLMDIEAEEALLAGDSDLEEPVIFFVSEEKLLESDTEDDQYHNEKDTTATAKNEPHAEREELYLREQLLKATLLRKMEDSGEKLLKHSENGVVSSRQEINRELTSLLAEISSMSDLKAVVKSRQDSVAALRNQLHVAEQKLDSALLAFDNHNERRKRLTGKALGMRKKCITLVKQCRGQGQKLKGQSYRVPAIGVREMKLKLQEVRKQNIIFRKEYLKLKKSIARLDLQISSAQSSKTMAGSKQNAASKRKKARGTNRKLSNFHGAKLRDRNHILVPNFKTWTSGSPTKLSDYRRLTKYGNCSDDDSHSDSESVFLLPYFRFKDVMIEDRPGPISKGQKPVVPYTIYESPIGCIAQHLIRRSSRPGLSSNVDPFSSLCFFELRGMCNDAECSFQHLYRSNSNGQNRATSTKTPNTLNRN